MILVAAMLMVAMAAGNGVTEPVGQSIVLLQRGNTAERREAVSTLARLGDQRAVEPLAEALTTWVEDVYGPALKPKKLAWWMILAVSPQPCRSPRNTLNCRLMPWWNSFSFPSPRGSLPP
ncbi:hypothetical protein C2W62_42115 [Candidatus Entotheonella serta]|nr:hypothetical protein C2W62_42115 [Candidatus Entotheonella serta]